MVARKLISQSFSDSGILDLFSLDEAKGRDALPHILIGDEYGGAHHLRTIDELEVEGRQVASTIARPVKSKRPSYYRQAQKVQDNGVFRAKVVRIKGADGNLMEKETGSIFFPDEWTTQELLESVVEVSKTPGEHNPDTRAYTHKGTSRGVPMIVNTDDTTGKIVAARPERG